MHQINTEGKWIQISSSLRSPILYLWTKLLSPNHQRMSLAQLWWPTEAIGCHVTSKSQDQRLLSISVSQQSACSFICSSIFIGPESDHWECLSLTHSLTDWLTDCCLVNLIDVTLACEDDNSKLVEVVTVAHVDNEKRVDNSLVQIWKVIWS